MDKQITNQVSSSFRDPSGFLFFKDNSIYRQVNKEYKDNYEKLIKSGLYKKLTDSGLLIIHNEIEDPTLGFGEYYKIIQPEIVPFISYPYEWCFSQLKDAALSTLEIQKIALNHNMSLKDASAYNIQFFKGRPLLIDTLSFEIYNEGQPWVAYKQFCQHFLAPLSLMSLKDIRLNQVLKLYIDGIPLDLTSKLLPFSTRLNFSLLSHIHLHANTQQKMASKQITKTEYKMSKFQLLALIDSLESAVKKLNWQPAGTEWGDYYQDTNYSKDSFEYKKELISKFIDKTNPKTVWDLGGNTGKFSRIASDKNIKTISFDIDPSAVEKNYLETKQKQETNIIPLLLDLTNPTPAIGWENNERDSFIDRGPVDMVFALALIHHLAISNNVPLIKIAEFFNKVCHYLIIEFVPKSDSQVQRLLATREDIFVNYKQEVFESEFLNFFNIIESQKLKDSERTLYLMQRHNT